MIERRFKPYRAYKDSGVEWLGQIPAHWDAVKMWRICHATSGGTPAKEELGYWDGDIPWISPKDMKRRFIQSSEDTITERALAETGLKLIAPPVILIVVRGMILVHTFPVAITRVPLTINQDMKALHFRHDVEPGFIAWLFEGIGKAMLGAVVEEAAHGTRVIRMDQWRSVIVPVPPIDEQRAVAFFLDWKTAKIDALLAKKERLIELLQEKRTALITRTVTKGLPSTLREAQGRPEPRRGTAKSGQAAPSVPLKDSGVEWMGRIPPNWEVRRLKFVLAAPLKYGANEAAELDDPDLPRYVRITDIDENDGLRDETFKSLPSEVAKEYLLREGDLLFARSGATAGKTFLYRQSWGRCAYAGYLIRARLDMDRSIPEFIRYFTASSTYWQWLSSAFIQATIQNVSAERYASLRLPLPPLAEQRDIVAFLDRETAKLDDLVAKVRDAIGRLKEFRTALISAAVTGKIDVREDIA